MRSPQGRSAATQAASVTVRAAYGVTSEYLEMHRLGKLFDEWTDARRQEAEEAEELGEADTAPRRRQPTQRAATSNRSAESSVLRTATATSDLTAGGDADAPISAKDLEGSSTTYFNAIYHGSMTVPQLVDSMKEFASHDRGSWKHEVYSRVVSRLLDESRLFPKYSLHDLSITAAFLGLLINHDLVHASDLDLAHSCVLEALRRPMHTKMFRFGVLALEQFLDRLPAFPALCQDLARIQDLSEAFPDYGQQIKDITMTVPEESPCGGGRRAREDRRRRAAPSKLFRVVADSGFRAISSFAESAPADGHARGSEGPAAIEGFPKLKLMPLYQGPWRLNI